MMTQTDLLFAAGSTSTRGVLFLTAGLEDGHGAVVQSADLLPEGAQALLVRRLVDRQHLLHLTQRVHQVVGGGTLLWRRRGGVRGQSDAAGKHQVSRVRVRC